MKAYLKCGASAIALLAAITLAQAQTNERQGGGASSGAEKSSGERGETGKASSAGEMGSNASQQHQGKAGEEHSQGSSSQKGRTAEERTGAGEQKGRTAEEQKGSQHQGRTAEENQQKGRETRTENERDSGKQQSTTSQSTTERGEKERSAQGSDRNRDSSGRSEARNESGGDRTRVNIRVTPEQKTRIHEFVQRDSAIHRYRHSDIHFSVNVGTRIPDTITFYDPPPQFVEIEPEFRRYKIIVLDDEVLIVDPDTREIVDVIQT